jgi:two-component system sensor histidine kinase RegB
MVSNYLDESQVRFVLRRMVLARWCLIFLAFVAIALLPALLRIEPQTVPMLAILVTVSVWNCWSQKKTSISSSTGPWEIAEQLAVDLIALAGLLFFSGGATNPLVFLLLPPVAVAALTLPMKMLAGISALAVASYSLLMVEFIPLVLDEPARASQLHLSGMWVTFVTTVGTVSWLVWMMSNTLRRRNAELARMREQSLRDEQVFALGALAAGAAHELGTPLATLAVLVDELQHGGNLDAQNLSDLQLMRAQITYCKSVLSGLTETAQVARAQDAEQVACDEWIRALFMHWQRQRKATDATLIIADSLGNAPTMVADPTLDQGLMNLLDNAHRAGPPVKLSMSWDPASIAITIKDNGPGFSPQAMDHAGNQPSTAKRNGHGVGLILTLAAVERVGGHLELKNDTLQGAIARVVLPALGRVEHE